MKQYEVININKYGEIIEDLSTYPIPPELQKRIWHLKMKGQKKKKEAQK